MATATNNGLLPAFRTVDGSDNNLTNTSVNATGTDETRLDGPHYAGTTGNNIIDGPNARTISNVVTSGPQAIQPDSTGLSAWGYVFGQFVDHDLDMTKANGPDASIIVPNGDHVLPHGSTIPLPRANTDASNNFAPVNSVSAWLDLSQIYGSDATIAASLRTPDGHLKVSSGDNLPIVDGNFAAGDVRASENPELTGITTMFVREHNFQVDRLAKLHPNWTGDQLYDQAKAITTAEYENIVSNEFLPSILGKDAIAAYQGYDPNVDPRITAEFSFGAYRFGHSMVSGEIEKVDNQGNVLNSQSLGAAFTNTPAADEANGGLDAVIRQVASEPGQNVDVYAIDDLRNQLVSPPVSIDLIAIDVQRERDVGLGTLNQTREALGLKPYTSFDQITSDPTVAQNLKVAYGSVDNLDLFVGGLAENHVAGADVGETFRDIIADQFERVRDGDRFWWQNEGFDSTTKEMIGNTTLSDLILRDTDTQATQSNQFVATERHASNVVAENPDTPQLVIGVDAPGAVIKGGPAADTIVAGNTNQKQTLTGGGGTDTFVIDGSGHNATITDFKTTFDDIQFHGSYDKGDTVQIDNSSSGAVLKFGGNTVTLAGVSADQINQSDLTFLDQNGSSTSFHIT